jgi:alkylated DNA repair dioxygenase AlkB
MMATSQVAPENGFVDSGSSPPATVTVSRSETEPFGLNWTSYSTPALHDIVTGSIKELTALSRRGQTELRQRLLPALQEVRNRIAKGEAVDGCDTMKAYLSSVGLSDGILRQWEFRLREKEMQELLGETELAALPFEYEEDFLTREELAEFETVCKALPWKPTPNERNGFDLNEKGEKVWRAHRRSMQLMWCDVRGTHAENDRHALFGKISEAPAIIQTIVGKLSARVGRQVNYVSLMCYVDGESHLNWHQHSEDKGHDTPVMIVPCGQERKFSYRLKGTNERHDVLTHNGSLVVLPSSFNDTHEHAILDDKTATGTRYAINAKCMDEIYYGEIAAPAIEDDPELAALLAPLTAEERAALESETASVEAPAMETLPPEPEPDLARLRRLFKDTGVEVKKSNHGSKYMLDKLTASQLERIATVLVNV